VSLNRDHMIAIGEKGGQASGRIRRAVKRRQRQEKDVRRDTEPPPNEVVER